MTRDIGMVNRVFLESGDAFQYLRLGFGADLGLGFVQIFENLMITAVLRDLGDLSAVRWRVC